MAERETELAQEFSKNIRDDVRSVVLDASRLGAARRLRRGPSRRRGRDRPSPPPGYPDYVPFMTFAEDQEARAELLERSSAAPGRTTTRCWWSC